MVDAPTGLTVTPTVIKPTFSERFCSSESINCNEPIIFHYTTAAGALGILTSGQLWSTLVYQMNDRQECKYAHDVAVQCAYQLLNGTDENFRTRFITEFQSQLERISHVHIFAACFSEAADLLSQWRGYSGRSGYALGFAIDALKNISEKQDLLVSEVVYKPESQQELFRPIVRKLIGQFDQSLDATEKRREIDALFRPAVQMIAQESVRIKHYAFSEEREWRIHSRPFGDAHQKMDFVVRNEQIVVR